MRASYLFQITNLIVSASLLFIVLLNLSQGMYLQWVLFTTISGALIQLESSLSVIVTRHISRQAARGGGARLAEGLATAGRLYRRFASIGVSIMFLVGALYLAAADQARFHQTWLIDWMIFCIAYFVYYFLGNFACSLIAMERLQAYSWIGITTRLLNLAIAAVLLFAGLGVTALCVAVLASFITGALFYRARVRSCMREMGAGTHAATRQPEPIPLHHIAMHASYILGAYGIYRFGLMLDAGIGSDTARQASYGLALQIFALINILASVPITMRVAPLVRSVESGSREQVLEETARLGVMANGAFLSIATVFVLGGWMVNVALPFRGASLPHAAELTSLTGGFWVELNILVLVNALLASQEFRFCLVYFCSLAAALALASAAWALGASYYIAFVVVPMLAQASIAFPMIVRLVRRRFGFGFLDYLRSASRQSLELIRLVGSLTQRALCRLHL